MGHLLLVYNAVKFITAHTFLEKPQRRPPGNFCFLSAAAAAAAKTQCAVLVADGRKREDSRATSRPPDTEFLISAARSSRQLIANGFPNDYTIRGGL